MATAQLASRPAISMGPGDVQVLGIAAFLCGAIIAWAVQGGTVAHFELSVCLMASLAWMLLPVDATLVGLTGALGVAAVAAISGNETVAASPLAHLGDDTTVLIIAAFVLAKGVEASGLAKALTSWIIGKQRGFIGYLRIGLGVFGATFLIPSTAARASILLPFVSGGQHRMSVEGERRALMLMAPLVIVLGAFASPVAAAANLLAIQILSAQSDIHLSFAKWIALAVPLGLAMSALAVVVPWVMLRGDRAPAQVDEAAAGDGPSANADASDQTGAARVALLLVGIVALWATSSYHGIDPMLVAVLGAVLVTLPRVGVLKLSQALKSVDWALIVLLATAAYIGNAVSVNEIVADGVSRAATTIGALNGSLVSFWVLASMTLVAMLTHLAVNSRSARAALMLPGSIVVASAAGLDPAIIVLAVTAGTGFCVLTPVGSKALLIFSGADTALLRRDLVRVGLVLLPLQLVLTLVCAFTLWPIVLGGL